LQRLKTILENNGSKGKDAYKKSLEENDRVATGKTKNSIRFEVKQTIDSTKLTFYALDHIRALEEGRGKSTSNSGSGFFDDIVEWIQARGIPANPHAVYRKINESGWNTSLPNRTNGSGTKGIITDIDKQIQEDVKEDIITNSKMLILEELKTFKNGNRSS